MRQTNKSHLFLVAATFLLVFKALIAAGAETTAENKLQEARSRLAQFDQTLSLRERKLLKQTSYQEKGVLSPRLRPLFDQRRDLKEEVVFWENVSRLKQDLLKLPGREGGTADSKRSEGLESSEAEEIAEVAIRGFGELREQYKMIRPAIMHNMFVNMGIKQGGLCWQWARDLTKRLMKLDLKTFDILWATAREGTLREHNTVVVVSRGRDLSEGLFLDGWKHSGEPFWMKVKDDRKHPWKRGSYAGDDLKK